MILLYRDEAILHLPSPALLPFLLGSCYFNSAGHLVHAAAYNAAVDVGELKKDSACVYSDGKNDYVELTRYRFEEPVQTQYGIIFAKTEEKPMLIPTGKQMYRIDAATAAYLTGKSAACPAVAAPVPCNSFQDKPR